MSTRHMIVTVNGTAYDVQVQMLDDDGVLRVPAMSVADQQRRPAAQPAPAAAEQSAPAPSAPAPAAASSAQATPVTAPLAGTVVNIPVAVGAQVSEGQAVVTLEAMKMNTDISAPCAGVVASVDCTSGASVAEGAVLLTITPQS